MSIEQNTTPEATLTSPVPAPEASATTSPAPPAPVSTHVPTPPAAPPVKAGSLVTYTHTDADGVESQRHGLVAELFNHPNEHGELTSHARVILLPAPVVVLAANLTPQS